MRSRVSVIDLFSGCGGLSLGFRQAGFDIRVGVENDLDSAATFRRNFPEAVIAEADARELRANIVQELGVRRGDEFLAVIGGPPCQGFSTLRWGRKKNDDPRNELVVLFAELVREIKPDAWLLENVPALQSHQSFLEAMSILGSGFTIHGPKIINAADFGVPQVRRRLFVVGVRSGVEFRFPRKRQMSVETVRTALEDLPQAPEWTTVEDPTEGRYPNHQKSKHSEAATSRLLALKPGQSHLDLPPHLGLECHRRAKSLYGKKVYRNVYGRMDPELPAPTITGGCINVTRGRFGHPWEPRAITPREAARLQTFPDTFAFAGGRESVARQIGNAVPVRLAKRLAFSFRFPRSRRRGGVLD